MDEQQQLIAELRRELEEEWRYNHSEHCGHLPHEAGEQCHWPRPAILDNDALRAIPALPEYAEPPYLRR